MGEVTNASERAGTKGAEGKDAVMARLRTETRELHTATERTELAQAMIRGSFTRPQYVTQLAAYRRIHQALEASLAASSDGAVRGAYRSSMDKVALLDADLGYLADVPVLRSPALEEALSAILAHATVAPSTGPEAELSAARLLGMLYVLEGSSLGAAFLLPRLKAGLGLEDEGIRYYAGYGPRTGAEWAAFSARMNESLVAPAAKDAAVDAARDLFRHIGVLFEAIWAAAHPTASKPASA